MSRTNWDNCAGSWEKANEQIAKIDRIAKIAEIENRKPLKRRGT